MISTPYLRYISSDKHGVVYFKMPYFSYDSQLTLQYGFYTASISDNNFPFNPNFNISGNMDSIIIPICCLKIGTTYTAQLQVETTAYPYSQTSQAITVWVDAEHGEQ
jgi:hypothetical protein